MTSINEPVKEIIQTISILREKYSFMPYSKIHDVFSDKYDSFTFENNDIFLGEKSAPIEIKQMRNLIVLNLLLFLRHGRYAERVDRIDYEPMFNFHSVYQHLDQLRMVNYGWRITKILQIHKASYLLLIKALKLLKKNEKRKSVSRILSESEPFSERHIRRLLNSRMFYSNKRFLIYDSNSETFIEY